MVQTNKEMGSLLAEALGPDGLDIWTEQVAAKGVEPKRRVLQPPTGYAASGYLGQYLVMYPQKKLVAVRQYRGPDSEKAEPPAGSGFDDFYKCIEDLVK